MAVSTDTLMKRNKDVSQDDIDSLSTAINDLIIIPGRSAECCSYMRQVFTKLQASDSDSVARLGIPPSLVSTLLQGGSSSQQKGISTNKIILCNLLISELLPEVCPNDLHIVCQDSEGWTHNLIAGYLLLGKNRRCFSEYLQAAVRWLQSQNLDKQKSGLSFVTLVYLLHGEFMDADTIVQSSETLAHWLGSASIKQAPNISTFNRFRKDEESDVTEIDGTPNISIFTVLNIGQHYSDNQARNIFSFSLLHKWLVAVVQTYRISQCTNVQMLHDDSSVEGIQSLNFVKKMMGLLLPKTVDYCFRLIEQCERKTKGASDTELQVACLVETVHVLDIICSLDHDQTARVFQEMKRLNTRLMNGTSQSPVFIPILTFFLHHSTSVVHDPQEAFKHFFQTVVSTLYKDQGSMYDTLDFLLQNIRKIAETTDILTEYFPNLFKILAWHPRVFHDEFASLLPAMMNAETSIEIFHLLLDLPCMTAALEVMERARMTEPLTMEFDSEPTSSLEAFYSPRFRPLFSYITRCESGQGDTIDRLAQLHLLLRDGMSSTRVMVCCQLVPVLLRIWFHTVLISDDAVFIAHLLPVVTERSGLLFGVSEFIEDIHKIFAENILNLCTTFPEIIVRQHADLCEFIQTTANMAGRVEIYSNVIFALGDYCTQMHSPDTRSEVIGKYYESLEVVTYELLNHLGSQEFDPSIPKVLSSLMSALSKLASRSQDLIPRAILCLTKVVKQQNLIMLSPCTKSFLTNKAASLIVLLKHPDSASLLLRPSSEIGSGKYHLHNTSIASVMRGMHRLIRD
ncbi:hypothetical protein BsWGS_09859 [Bradybaena similaris]